MRGCSVSRGCHVWASAALALSACVCGPPVWAQLPSEAEGVVEKLAPPTPHWVWVNDMAFFAFPDGKAFLVDGDSGKMLGMLSTGYSFTAVLVPKTHAVIYAPETYFSRGTRGTRTDVVSIYDATQLLPVAEIEIPPKRASVMPMPGAQALTDDDRPAGNGFAAERLYAQALGIGVAAVTRAA